MNEQKPLRVIEEMSEDNRVEAARQTNEALFHQVWETTSDAMALSDREGVVLAANPAYLELYGYTSEQIIGHSFAIIFPEEHRAWALQEYKNVFAGDTSPAAFESVVRRADGSERIVESRATFLTVAGKRTAMLSTIRDITERKQADERLQTIYQLSESANRAEAVEQIYEQALVALERVLQVDRASILLFDVQGVMRFHAWHGLSPDYRRQVDGHSPWTIDEPDPQPILVADVRDHAELGALQPVILGEGIYALAFIPLIEQGRLLGKFMLYYDQPHHFTEAEVQWAQAIARHVAHALQRKQAEEALRQFNARLEQHVEERTRELERSNRELDQFAYAASHDLMAPLRAISLLARWIEEDAADRLPAPSLAHLAKLKQRIQRMEMLLRDLLAYSRAARQSHPREHVETAAMVNQIVELLGLPDGFTVRMAELMPVLVTERVALEMVLRNLIGNAIKHHHRPDVGHVWVTTQVDDEWIKFSVTDDGPGIEPQFHERIFDVFQTLKPRDEVEGSGMGLAIVKRLVEMRGGRIDVESTLGQGTTFCFTWPTHGPGEVTSRSLSDTTPAAP